MTAIETVQYRIVNGPSADDIMSKFMNYFDPSKYRNPLLYFTCERETNQRHNLGTVPAVAPGTTRPIKFWVEHIRKLERVAGGMNIGLEASHSPSGLFYTNLDVTFTPGSPRRGVFLIDRPSEARLLG
jgi:hypothetical protein